MFGMPLRRGDGERRDGEGGSGRGEGSAGREEKRDMHEGRGMGGWERV